MKNQIKFTVLLIASLLLANTSCAYESAHDVEILYWSEVKNGQYHYYYNVVNNSTEVDIVNVEIGYEYDFEDGAPKLQRARGDKTHIPLEFIKPNGWTGKVAYQEETLDYSLMWTTTGEQFDIKKGKSSFRFGVVLDNQRDDHINTFFTIIFGDSTVATEEMVASSEPPRNVILAPIYDLLLSKGIKPNVIGMSKRECKYNCVTAIN